LILRQYADHSPHVGWPRDGTHYVVLSGKACVGSIVRQPGGPSAGHWGWSIGVIHPQEGAMRGTAPSKEAAQAALAAAWRSWLAEAGLTETGR
jgi:hypothetical protein